MTAYALTHSTSWSAGIVGAPVTDWRDYDTVYTERLMKMPQNNPDGYRRTAPRFAADQLHGTHAADSRHDGRQRAHAEHGAVRLRAAARRQAVRDDDLPALAPRLHRSAAERAPAADDVRLRDADDWGRDSAEGPIARFRRPICRYAITPISGAGRRRRGWSRR